MAEELQKLLERIQKDGVEKADAETGKILAAARERAAAMVREAEAKAVELRKQTEREAAVFAERGRQALQQGARDVMLSIGDSLNAVLAAVVAREVKTALTVEVVQQMLVSLVGAYAKSGAAGTRLEVLLAPEQEKAVTQYFLSKLSDEVRKGVVVGSDRSLTAGFKVTVVNQKVQHDFSGAAIAEALSQVLRPRLAEIVKEASGSKGA